MRHYYLFLLLFLSGITSCRKDEPSSESGKPVITGYYQRSITGGGVNGGDPEIVGNPNTRLGDGNDFASSDYYMISYPNPCMGDQLVITIKSPSESSQKKLWIVPAEWNEKAPENIPAVTKETLDRLSELNITLSSHTSAISINTSKFTNRYYRVYLEVNGKLFYDNVLIQK